ncbi:MAG: hypothetical protein ACI94O_001657, partial [Octadecabacter sp.]
LTQEINVLKRSQINSWFQPYLSVKKFKKSIKTRLIH